MKKYLYFFSLIFLTLIFFVTYEKKAEPIVTIGSDLQRPISCMKLNKLSEDKKLLRDLEKLYSFNDSCNFSLTLESKKDIVCNSTNNIMSKNMGDFPKSYIKLKLRKGLKLQYTYYRDLYSNVDEDDLKDGFERLKKDLLNPKEK